MFVIHEYIIFRDILKLEDSIKSLSSKSGVKEALKPSYLLNNTRVIDDYVRNIFKNHQNKVQDLKKMADFREQFVADVSHELKTPLFAVQGYVHTLLDGALTDQDVSLKFLGKAAKSLDGLDALVQDLLMLSHIEIGKTGMQLDHFDATLLVSEVFEQLEGRASAKNIRLQTESVEKNIFVFGDYSRIFQVMLNLVSNAIKYNNENGLVKVGLQDQGSAVKVTVQDTGIGIPPDDIGNVFERFYTVDKSRSRAKGGTGLGLAIVKQIIENHGSEINLQSKLGEGSVFSFTLPKDKIPTHGKSRAF